MSSNQLIIVNEKHQEIARHELTDRDAENFRRAEPMKRFPNIRATATYRKHGGGLVVYAREQAHDGKE